MSRMGNDMFCSIKRDDNNEMLCLFFGDINLIN